MTKKYFTWFLENYDNYEYFGDEATSIKRRLKRMSERTIAPSPQEAVEIYAQFYKHYNGDPFSSKSKYIDGIRAKRAEFCLIFREPDNTPIPFAYKRESSGGVTEGDLKDTLDTEKERKIKYYQDMLEYHSGVMDNTERVIIDIKDMISPHATDASSIGFFILALIFVVFGAGIFFVPAASEFLKITEFIPKLVSLILCSSLFVLFIVLGFIVGKKYSFYANSNQIMYRMEDFRKRVNKNIIKLNKHDTSQIRTAMRAGKKTKPIIADTDYYAELRYFGTSLDLMQAQLELKPKATRRLFYVIRLITVYTISLLLVGVYCKYLSREITSTIMFYVLPAVPTFISVFVGIKSRRSVRAWKLFVAIILAAALMALLVLIFGN